MNHIRATIACNLDADLLAAALPLFADERVEAIEWSFDTLYQVREIPDWFLELLRAYSDADRLIGHGVYFSLFSGRWTSDQQAWLDELERKCQHFRFDHITEHFGFMTGADFHKGAPVSIPRNETTLRIGRDRLQRMYQACRRPVGLENLAFSYSIEEVIRHGAFLRELLEPVNGFIILDLHNLYCQLHNFELEFEKLIELYPLDLVREIHISGGSWEAVEGAPEEKVRRDTHNDRVPERVFQLLEQTIPLCPHLKYVVLEQLGTGLKTEAAKVGFREDFIRMRALIREAEKSFRPRPRYFLPDNLPQIGPPAEDARLAQQQAILSDILENSETPTAAAAAIRQSELADSDWRPETWAPHMLETVHAIAQKWKDGF